MTHTVGQEQLTAARKRLASVSNEFTCEWKALLAFAAQNVGQEKKYQERAIHEWNRLLLHSEGGLKLLTALEKRREDSLGSEEPTHKMNELRALTFDSADQFLPDSFFTKSPHENIQTLMRECFTSLTRLSGMYLGNLERFSQEYEQFLGSKAYTQTINKRDPISFSVSEQRAHADLLHFMEQTQSACLSFDDPNASLLKTILQFIHFWTWKRQFRKSIDVFFSRVPESSLLHRSSIRSRFAPQYFQDARVEANHSCPRFNISRDKIYEELHQQCVKVMGVDHDVIKWKDKSDPLLTLYVEAFFHLQMPKTAFDHFPQELVSQENGPSPDTEGSKPSFAQEQLRDFTLNTLYEDRDKMDTRLFAYYIQALQPFDKVNACLDKKFRSNDANCQQYSAAKVTVLDAIFISHVENLRVDDSKYHIDRLKHFSEKYMRFAHTRDTELGAKHGEMPSSWVYCLYLLKILYSRQLRQKIMRILNYMEYVAMECQHRVEQARLVSRKAEEELRVEENKFFEFPWTAEMHSNDPGQFVVRKKGEENGLEYIFPHVRRKMYDAELGLVQAASAVVNTEEGQDMQLEERKEDKSRNTTTAIDRSELLIALFELELEFQTAKFRLLSASGIDRIASQDNTGFQLNAFALMQQRPAILYPLRTYGLLSQTAHPSVSFMEVKEGYLMEIRQWNLKAKLIDQIRWYLNDRRCEFVQSAIASSSQLSSQLFSDNRIAFWIISEQTSASVFAFVYGHVEIALERAKRQWNSAPLSSITACLQTLSLSQAVMEHINEQWTLFVPMSALSLECQVGTLYTRKIGYEVVVPFPVILDAVAGWEDKAISSIDEACNIFKWLQWHDAMGLVMHKTSYFEDIEIAGISRDSCSHYDARNAYMPLALALVCNSSMCSEDESSKLLCELLGIHGSSVSAMIRAAKSYKDSQCAFWKILRGLLMTQRLWNELLRNFALYQNAATGSAIDSLAIASNEASLGIMEAAINKEMPHILDSQRWKDHLHASFATNSNRTGEQNALLVFEEACTLTKAVISEGIKVPFDLFRIHQCLKLLEQEYFVPNDTGSSHCAFQYALYPESQSEAPAPSEVARPPWLLYVPKFEEYQHVFNVSQTMQFDKKDSGEMGSALQKNLMLLAQINEAMQILISFLRIRCCLQYAHHALTRTDMCRLPVWALDGEAYHSIDISMVKKRSASKIYSYLHESIHTLHVQMMKDCKPQTPMLLSDGDLPATYASSGSRDTPLPLRILSTTCVVDKERVLASIVKQSRTILLELKSALLILEIRLILSRESDSAHNNLKVHMVQSLRAQLECLDARPQALDCMHVTMILHWYLEILLDWSAIAPQCFENIDVCWIGLGWTASSVQFPAYLYTADYLYSLVTWLTLVLDIVRVGCSCQGFSATAMVDTLHRAFEAAQVGPKGSIVAGLSTAHPEVIDFFHSLPICVSLSGKELKSAKSMHVPLHLVLINKQCDILRLQGQECRINRDIQRIQAHYEKFLVLKQLVWMDVSVAGKRCRTKDNSNAIDISKVKAVSPQSLISLSKKDVWPNYLLPMRPFYHADPDYEVSGKRKNNFGSFTIPEIELLAFLEPILRKAAPLLQPESSDAVLLMQTQYQRQSQHASSAIDCLKAQLFHYTEEMHAREIACTNVRIYQQQYQLTRLEMEMEKLRCTLRTKEKEQEDRKAKQCLQNQIQASVIASEAALHEQCHDLIDHSSIGASSDPSDLVLLPSSGHLTVRAKTDMVKQLRIHRGNVEETKIVKTELTALKRTIVHLQHLIHVEKSRHHEVEAGLTADKENLEARVHMLEAEVEKWKHHAASIQADMLHSVRQCTKAQVALEQTKMNRKEETIRRKEKKFHQFVASCSGQLETKEKKKAIGHHKKAQNLSLGKALGSGEIEDHHVSAMTSSIKTLEALSGGEYGSRDNTESQSHRPIQTENNIAQYHQLRSERMKRQLGREIAAKKVLLDKVSELQDELAASQVILKRFVPLSATSNDGVVCDPEMSEISDSEHIHRSQTNGSSLLQAVTIDHRGRNDMDRRLLDVFSREPVWESTQDDPRPDVQKPSRPSTTVPRSRLGGGRYNAQPSEKILSRTQTNQKHFIHKRPMVHIRVLKGTPYTVV